MIFISERITNISELESLIRDAKFNFEVLIRENEKAIPSLRTINSTTSSIKEALEKASNFEFCIEKRKCVFKEASDSPILQENFSDVRSSD